MNYYIKESNKIIKSFELNLKAFDWIISEGSNNTIYLEKQIGVAPGPGNNFIYGVNNWNFIQYFSSPIGIYVDANKGIIRNGFGGVDTFTGITGFQGTGFSDYFIGSSRNEVFSTGRGSDTVVGGGGYDRASVEYGSELFKDFNIDFNSETNTYTIVSLNNPNQRDVFIDIDEITFADKTIYNPNSIGIAKNAKFVGYWKPINDSEFVGSYKPVLSNSYWSNFNFGEAGLEGLIGIGWSYSAEYQYKLTKITPVNSLLIEQDSNGNLKVVTDDYLKTSLTNGGGSIIIADFNSDKKQDILLIAENESPFLGASSTAYISNILGKFDVINLQDSISAHDAQLINFQDLNHKPSVVTKTYYSTNKNYDYINGKFEFNEPKNSNILGGGSLAVVDLNGDGNLEKIIGDITFTKNTPFGNDKWYIGIFPFGNNDVQSLEPLRILTPYMTARTEYSESYSQWGKGITHTYRIWTDDFNYDGKIDILAGTSMYIQNIDSPCILQMFQNKGNLDFTDVTDQLFKINASELQEIDYELQIRDIDKSGINSYISSGKLSSNSIKHSNFILLNDGSGNIHEYLRKEFSSLLNDTLIFAKQNGYINSTEAIGKFHSFITKEGTISFLVEIGTGDVNNIPQELLIQLPLNLNPKLDFKKDIFISDRNNSSLLRTWAGDDTFNEKNINLSGVTNIDGGLGLDTSIYSQKINDYQIINLGESNFSIKHIASSNTNQQLNDVLVNIERLKFSDKSIAIDINGNAGTTAKILGAVFGKQAVTNKSYVGIGLHFLDAGWTYDNLAGLALDAAGAKTNDQIVSLLWTNVIGTNPTLADKQPFIALLENGMSAGALAHLAADTSFNTTNINLVGLAQTGIEYLPVS